MSCCPGSGKLDRRSGRGPRKESFKERFGLVQSVIGEDDGFGFGGGVGNQALLVQAIQSRPIEPFSGPPLIVQRQPQQPENGVVDPVCVDLHA